MRFSNETPQQKYPPRVIAKVTAKPRPRFWRFGGDGFDPSPTLIAFLIAGGVFLLFICFAAVAEAAPRENIGPDAPRIASTASKHWAAKQITWAKSEGILHSSLMKRGPETKMSRAQFIIALANLQRWRAEQAGETAAIDSLTVGTALPDAPAKSLYAKAVRLRWITPVQGKFWRSRAITTDEATLATLSALGLRSQTVLFAQRLKAEVPRARVSYMYAAAHVVARQLDLRFNVLVPNDRLELGPKEHMPISHASYMLHAAGPDFNEWDLYGVERLAEQFELPALTGPQHLVLRKGLEFIGHPYVWGGETEGAQAEGHGGFDCSGFSWRVLNGSPTASRPVGERTTYTMSAIGPRIALAQLRPGDMIFFGGTGRTPTKPAQNEHMGLYMGSGWFIHSAGSNGGVSIDYLEGYWAENFGWGRRSLIG